MISEGYEKALFELPVAERYSLGEATEDDDPHGSVRVITEEYNFLRDLRRTARVVKLVVDSREKLFDVVQQPHFRKNLVIAPTRLGQALMTLHHVTQDDMERYFPLHGFNPYVDLLFKARKEKPGDTAHHDYWKLARGEEAVQVAAQLNAFVDHLRHQAAGREFKRLLDRFRRSCDKNTRSVRRYIDAIFQHRGWRHLVIRLELGYAPEGSWAAARPTTVTLKQAKEDLAKFQRYLRERLPSTGFVAKLEFGLLRGYHFHALIFLNGDLLQRDVLIARRLGEYWAQVVTEGKGRYFNCNAVTYAERGIGMVKYDDGAKRVVLLDRVAGYLTKTDFWLRFQPGGKTLFKGLAPQPRPRRGRPRQSDC